MMRSVMGTLLTAVLYEFIIIFLYFFYYTPFIITKTQTVKDTVKQYYYY